MSDLFARLPEPKLTAKERLRRRIIARNKHMPVICRMLEIEYKPMGTEKTS